MKYLGLVENIRVRVAGFAYRREFDKFVRRYAILTNETWPLGKWRQGDRAGAEHILRLAEMRPDEFQMGHTKIFIKAPESVRRLGPFLSLNFLSLHFLSLSESLLYALYWHTVKKIPMKSP